MNNIPTPQQVKDIFKETYLFYLKYINSSTDKEFQDMLKESNDLYSKYPFDLCKSILIEVCNTIERYAKSRRES